MTNNGGTTKSATYSLDTTNSRVVATVPANAYYNTSSKLYATYSTVRTLIGLTAAKIIKGNTILGLAGTGSSKFESGDGSMEMNDYSSSSKSIQFSTSFGSTPSIYIVLKATQFFSYTVSNKSSTGFTLTISRAGGSTSVCSYHWYAIY